MLNTIKTSAKIWIFGLVFLLFFFILSFGFTVFVNTKGLSAGIENIRKMGFELRKVLPDDEYPSFESLPGIKKYLDSKNLENKWIKNLNILVKGRNQSSFAFPSEENSEFITPTEEILTTIKYKMDKFEFQMLYPLETNNQVSTYLYVEGNILYFFKITWTTTLYVGLSLICFFLLGLYFLIQHSKLQKMIEMGKNTEKILAKKSSNDEIIARFARTVLISNTMHEASMAVNQAVSSLTGSQYIVSGFIDQDQGLVELFGCSYDLDKTLEEVVFKKSLSKIKGICGKAINSGKGLYLNKAENELSILPGKVQDFYLNSVIAVPAAVKNKVVGIIAAGSRDIEFNHSIKNQFEKIAALFAVAIQKHQAFLKVAESENQFRVAFKTNPDAVVITTFPEGVIVDVNDGFTKITGYEAEEVKDHLALKFIFWEKMEDRFKMIDMVEKDGIVINYESKFQLKSGKFITGLFSASKIILNGKPHLLSIVREIEKLKEVENELRKERAFLSKVVETSPAGIIAVDGKSGEILYANQRTAEILGQEADEIKCKSFNDKLLNIRDFNLNKLDDDQCIFNLLKRKKTKLQDIRHVVTLAEKGMVHLSFNATPLLDEDGDIEMFVASIEDVSQKVLAQKHLKEAQERLSSVISSLPVVLWAFNSEGVVTLCRGMGLKPFGLKPDSLVGVSAFKLYKNFPEIVDLIKEGLKFKAFTKVIKFIDRYYEVTISPIINDKNQAVGVSGVAADISRRVKMEEERLILSVAMDQAAESIVITDKEGAILYVNPAFENLTGYSRREAIGQKPNILKSGFHGSFFYEEMWNRLKQGLIWKGYFRNKSRDGDMFEEEASISPVFDRSGEIRYFVAVKKDVTHERKMESLLRKSQKLEAIGTLAGGIAHDFNNILFPIIGFSELLSNRYEKGSDEKRYIINILSAASRARDLVHQILTFSRQNEEEKKPVRIDLIINEVLKLLRASIPATIEIRTKIEPEIEKTNLTVFADPTKIHQLIMNLGTNAFHSMENKGGVLKISLEAVELDEKDIDRSLMPDIKLGKYLKLVVSDTGDGISQDVIEKIFDPYFTTKLQGKGTGLGLATVHGIVKSCRGFLRVFSEKGKGSSFNTYLPIAKESDNSNENLLSERIKGGKEHILVVDDEELIVEVMGGTLKGLGYKTTLRTSSLEAFEAFKAAPDAYDLLVTDHTMPNMTGLELARKVHSIRKDFPVIICSGFTGTVKMEKNINKEISAFIMKPVLKKDLAAAVRKAIDPVKKESSISLKT